MKNINETELNILNNTTKKSKANPIWTGIYYTFKIILEAVYIAVCIVCTTIEVLAWILTLGTATKIITKRRYKRWY